jgi:hypothetical protein
MTSDENEGMTRRPRNKKRQSTAAVHNVAVVASGFYTPAFWSAAAHRRFPPAASNGLQDTRGPLMLSVFPVEPRYFARRLPVYGAFL